MCQRNVPAEKLCAGPESQIALSFWLTRLACRWCGKAELVSIDAGTGSGPGDGDAKSTKSESPNPNLINYCAQTYYSALKLLGNNGEASGLVESQN